MTLCKYCVTMPIVAIICRECVYSRSVSIPNLPLKLKDRICDKRYIFDGKIVICKGGILFCIHNKRRTKCSHPECISPSNNCIHEVPRVGCDVCIG
jgi:hypothetical protein